MKLESSRSDGLFPVAEIIILSAATAMVEPQLVFPLLLQSLNLLTVAIDFRLVAVDLLLLLIVGVLVTL